MLRVTPDAFPEAYLAELVEGLTSSPYLGKSPLGEEFIRTEGFSVVFRRSQLARVLDCFPYLRGFLETAAFASSNAFYVNPLIMGQASRVEAHVDCRLLEEEDLRIVPTLVSVLYVACDEALEGGELCFNPGTESERSIQPKTNDLLHFKGDLVHLVREISVPARRISLVCEQYNLPEHALAAFPEFAILQSHDPAPRVRLA